MGTFFMKSPVERGSRIWDSVCVHAVLHQDPADRQQTWPVTGAGTATSTYKIRVSLVQYRKFLDIPVNCGIVQFLTMQCNAMQCNVRNCTIPQFTGIYWNFLYCTNECDIKISLRILNPEMGISSILMKIRKTLSFSKSFSVLIKNHPCYPNKEKTYQRL